MIESSEAFLRTVMELLEFEEELRKTVEYEPKEKLKPKETFLGIGAKRKNKEIERYNQEIDRQNKAFIAAMEAGRERHLNYQKELYEFKTEVIDELYEILADAKFFFQVPFYPIDTPKRLMCGETCMWNDNVDWVIGCSGGLKITGDRLDGWKKAVPCDLEGSLKFSDGKRMLVLYWDGKLAFEHPDDVFTVKTIYETEREPCMRRNTQTTTKYYDIDRAVEDYNRQMDTWESGLYQGRTSQEAYVGGMLSYTEHAADSYYRGRGEKRIREALGPETHTMISESCIGENLVIREKGYLVFCDNKLVSFSVLPERTEELHLTYEFDHPIKLESLLDAVHIPEGQRYHGKITRFERQKVTADLCSTMVYVAEHFSKYMEPFTPLMVLPNHVDPRVWRLWVTECYRHRKERRSER